MLYIYIFNPLLNSEEYSGSQLDHLGVGFSSDFLSKFSFFQNLNTKKFAINSMMNRLFKMMEQFGERMKNLNTLNFQILHEIV